MIHAAVFALLFLGCARAAEENANSPARFTIQWRTNAPSDSRVAVVGDPSEIDSASPATVFIIDVEQEDLRGSLGVPAVSGKYEVTKTGLEFKPRFPFEAGVTYRATFYPKTGRPVSSVMAMPRRQLEPSTVVTQIYPTSGVLPENLLKFYLYFSAPMSRGHIYDYIHLYDETGTEVELPFLEIDEELWNPEMTRLTLFLDPGRIKRGVKPLEEVGPALQAGTNYTLKISASWLDAAGTPLKNSFEKKFRVAEVDREAPDLAKWEVSVPSAGTKQPLKVRFSDPLDHALAMRMISVDRAGGTARLEEHEQVWAFLPEEPWKAGSYRLLVQTTIEDLAGNNPGKPFEVDLFSEVRKEVTHEVAERRFEVK